jgi:CRP-like cAMP-binding protein
MTFKKYEEGEVVFRKGDKSDTYLMILSGVVELHRRYEPSETTFIRTMGKGEALGELGIINKQPRSLTVIS